MARLSPGRVRTVKAVPTIRPPRWNGLKPTQPASRAKLSEMTDVGALLNASISVAFGFATSVAAMVMVRLIGPLVPAIIFAAHAAGAAIGAEVAFLSVIRIAQRKAGCPSHSR